MVSNLAEAVFDIYKNVLTSHPEPKTLKPAVITALDQFSKQELIADSSEISAYHIIAIYGFYIEGDAHTWVVLPELVAILDDREKKLLRNGKDDYCFFDPNLSNERPKKWLASQFKRKGLVCLQQGGFFYEHQKRARANPPESQIRWTGKNSLEKAAELSPNFDVKSTCSELSRNYEDYEKGFRRIKDVFYSNANS